MSKKPVNETEVTQRLPAIIGATIRGILNTPIPSEEIQKTLKKAKEVNLKAENALARASLAEKNYKNLERQLSVNR